MNMREDKNLNRIMKSGFTLALVVSMLSLSLVSCSYDPNKTNTVKKAQKVLINKKASLEDMDFPSHDPSIKKGKLVYQKNCASCHGSVPGKYLTNDRMRSRTPQEQYLAVTKGNLKGMPSFRDSLTRDERWDALLYMRAQMLGYYEDGGDAKAKMDSIFGGNCAVCHGTRGDGDGPLHKSLDPMPANFNEFKRLYTRSDKKIFDEISHGIPWTAMPAWKGRYDFDQDYYFTDELVWKLVRYVRQFGFSQSIDRLDKGRAKLEEYKENLAKTKGAKK